MNLLEKLEKVTISEDERISKADKEVCEKHQKAYFEAKIALEETIFAWNEIEERQKGLLADLSEYESAYRRYIRISDFSVKDIENKIKDLPSLFINSIISYFSSTYNVSISEHEIKNVLLPHKSSDSVWDPQHKAEKEYQSKLMNIKINYQDVLEQIFIQLGGRTFTEKAIFELKQKCHSAAWDGYRGTPEYELKNNTIRFTFYACSHDDWLGRDRWKICDEMKHILKGIAHFETGILKSYPSTISYLLGYDDKNQATIEFSDCKKVEQLKMFKNHRVDVKFCDKETAELFISEYLGNVC